MKDSDFQRELRQTRKTGNEAVPVGYVNTDGIQVPGTGDAEAPFVKASPFVTEVEPYWDALPLPDAGTSYTTGAVIDATGYRVLIIYIEYTLGAEAEAQQLSLIPQGAAALNDPDAAYYPIGVINPVITGVTVLADAAYGSRTMYQTELRSPAGASFGTTLAFDVTPYEGFRFRVAEIDPGDEGGTLKLTYALSM